MRMVAYSRVAGAVASLKRVGLLVLLLLVLGWGTRWIEQPAWEVVQSGRPETNLMDFENSLGQGMVLGILGGFRAIMADFMWIRANTYWENRDAAKYNSIVGLVTTLDPRPMYFWSNAARTIAYDIPSWRVREEGGYLEVPLRRQREIDEEQAEQAFAFIDRGLQFHPESPDLYVEIAQIYMNRLKNDKAAAEWFLTASQQPDAPYFAARLYAELLRKHGKNQEAYSFLKALYPELPDTPDAQKWIVLIRIRELEDLLGVPEGSRVVE